MSNSGNEKNFEFGCLTFQLQEVEYTADSRTLAIRLKSSSFVILGKCMIKPSFAVKQELQSDNTNIDVFLYTYMHEISIKAFNIFMIKIQYICTE